MNLIHALAIFQILSFARAGLGDYFSPLSLAVEDVANNLRCRLTECCNQYGIPADFDGLERKLKERLYGQHLVQEIVVNALKSHWNGPVRPQKALTLSFHGWPGSGKNYVSRFIVESLYKHGSKSKFVHHLIGRIHFPSNDKAVQYQQELYTWIKNNVSSCGQHLFIFDEVDKMPPSVLNIIKPMIDYRDDVDGIDYRNAVFIFLSNTGSQLINEHYLYLWKSGGRKREDLSLRDFENVIAQGAFNEEGGFQHSDTIKANLIDHYVPFLPMERRHVRLCIIDEFKQRNVSDPQEKFIQEAMEFIEWGPSYEKIFSTTGCKRLSQKVGAIVAKYQLGVR